MEPAATSVLKSFVDLDTLAKAAGGAGILATGILPRAGPGRAIVVALMSVFRRRPRLQFPSVRNQDKDSLCRTLNALNSNQFIVCTGPQGIGKTRMINDFLSDKLGVISVAIEPGTKDSEIQRRVHCLFANALDLDFIHPASSSERVLKWFKFIFRRSPIVVIAAKERSVEMSEDYAQVPSAARELATMGFRVIVDAAPNSYPNERIGRERFLALSDLPVEMFRKDPEFRSMFRLLSKLGITSQHLSFIGGNPCKLEHLSSQLASTLALCDSVDCFDLCNLQLDNGQELRKQLRKVVLRIFQAELCNAQLHWSVVPKRLQDVAVTAFQNGRVHRISVDNVGNDDFRNLSDYTAFRRVDLHVQPASQAITFILQNGPNCSPTSIESFSISETSL